MLRSFVILGHRFIDLCLRRKKMNAKTEWFEQTSDELYDRHDYKIVYSNSQSVVVDNWHTVRALWFEAPAQFLSHVEVLDKKPSKSKGFG